MEPEQLPAAADFRRFEASLTVLPENDTIDPTVRFLRDVWFETPELRQPIQAEPGRLDP